jgi:hypothetical protein
MTQPGLLHEHLMRETVADRLRPRQPGLLSRIGTALLEVAEAMLRPDRGGDR